MSEAKRNDNDLAASASAEQRCCTSTMRGPCYHCFAVANGLFWAHCTLQDFDHALGRTHKPKEGFAVPAFAVVPCFALGSILALGANQATTIDIGHA